MTRVLANVYQQTWGFHSLSNNTEIACLKTLSLLILIMPFVTFNHS